MSGGTEGVTKITELVDKYPHHNHYVGLLVPPRPGFVLFFSLLEYRHFPPNTAANEDLLMALFKWQEMTWATVSVPEQFHKIAEEIAETCGIRLISDGRPVLFSSKGAEQIPIHGRSVYFTENVRNSAVYDPAKVEKVRALERQLIEGIHGGLDPDIGEFTRLISPARP